MKAIVIEPTGHSPRVFFNTNGRLLLEGRSLPEDVTSFYDPLIDFIIELEMDKVILDVNMDYFNTATSKKMLELLKNLDANSKVGSVQINWHYESDDEESLELAEIYEEECTIRTTFQYFEHLETKSLSERVDLSV